MKVESGGRATARGGEGHNLVVGEGIGEVVKEKGEGVVVGGTGEPKEGRTLNDDGGGDRRGEGVGSGSGRGRSLCGRKEENGGFGSWYYCISKD